MKKQTTKRMLSILLCLVMVVGLLPAHVHADWEEGGECDLCGQYIYGDWVCDCGHGWHCSANSDHFDCYEEYHCIECGEFYWEEDRCAECGLCYNCAGDNGFTGDAFCPDCNRCVDCVPEEGFYFCLSCGVCADCTPDGKFCDMCYRCYDCGGGLCSEGTDHPCQVCHEGYTCPDCDQCLLVPDSDDKTRDFCFNCYRCEDCVEKCSAWGEGHYYCLEEHDDFDYCPDCKHCYAADIIDMVEGNFYGCTECNKCINCVSAVCKDCGKCFDCTEICERCGEYCLDCHDGHGEVCPGCGMCYKDVRHCYDCGYCYECTDLCNRCGHCLTCYASKHCGNCEACGFYGFSAFADLCESCGLCTECTPFCEECDLCEVCYPDNHCPDCYGHFDDDELCLSCGKCGECVGEEGLCESCGYCLDCAGDDHCSECHACKNDKTICESCGMCLDCAKSEGQHCSESECDNCYEDYLYCETCDKCIECIGEENYCFDCYQCKSHHVGGKCDGEGSHTHKVKDGWQSDAKTHWQVCHQCKEAVNTAAHTFNLNKKCTVCGYDATELIQFTSQPRSVRAKVSDTDADEDDPLCPNNNTVTFSVTAKAIGKGTLSYQWYYKFGADGTNEYKITDKDRTADYGGKTTGAQTAKLTLPVSWEACVQDFVYFCRVTLTSADGTVLYTADSDMAELKGIHVYNKCEPADFHLGEKIWFPRGTGSTYSFLQSSDGTHRYYCCGEGDEERYDPHGKAEVHNYGTAETVTASIVDPESSSFEGWKEFYKYTCKDCGFVSYVEKHAHHYEVPLYFGDEEALAFLTANVTDELHPLRCTVEGCSSVIYEEHDYQPMVYAPPTENADGTVSLGQYQLECHECEYVLSGRSLYEANNDTSWDTIRILVTAKSTAVQVLDSSDEFDTFCLATPGAIVVLTPQQQDGQKVTSWKIKYTDYSQKDSAGKYKTVDLIRPIYQDDTDGTWWFVAPDQKYYESWGVNNGGWFYLTPVYTECKHENGTKIVNQKEAVCIHEGYTGDEVCVDCGQIIGEIGDYIPAPSDEHEGEWVLIEGTKVEANCKHGGYTGDYQCSECGDIQKGKKVPVKHGERELRNVKEATCVSTGSTGDVYCKDCGKKLMSGREIPIDPDNHVNTTTSHIREPKCTVKGYISARKCKDCGEVLIAARTFPALGHSWDEGEITKAPTTTETGEKTLHCTRKGCSKTKIVTIPKLDAVNIASVALTVTQPSAGAAASNAATAETTCTIARTAWADYDGYDLAIGDTFAGGTVYLVQVELEAKDDNVFADSTVYTINGETATVVAWYMDYAILTVTFPATAHTHSFGAWVEEVPATCTDTGVKGHKDCTECGKHFDADGNEIADLIIPVNPNGHIYSAWEDAIPATCTDTGVQGHKDCTECGKHFDADGNEIADLVIAALGHDYAKVWSWDESAHWHACTRCGDVKDWEKHSYSSTNDSTCDVCDYVRGVTPPTPVGPTPAEPVKPVTPVEPTPVEPTPVTPVAPVGSELPFVDVGDAWYTEYVRYVYENGIMTGVTTTTFEPATATTRGMIVTMLARMEGVDTSGSKPWYEIGRQWAMENGISDGTNMEAIITREQLVTMLYRYAEFKGYDVSARAELQDFSDAGSVSVWAQDAMQWAVAIGLIQGNNGQLMPQGSASRAETAAIITRFQKYFAE